MVLDIAPPPPAAGQLKPTVTPPTSVARTNGVPPPPPRAPPLHTPVLRYAASQMAPTAATAGRRKTPLVGATRPPAASRVKTELSTSAAKSPVLESARAVSQNGKNESVDKSRSGCRQQQPQVPPPPPPQGPPAAKTAAAAAAADSKPPAPALAPASSSALQKSAAAAASLPSPLLLSAPPPPPPPSMRRPAPASATAPSSAASTPSLSSARALQKAHLNTRPSPVLGASSSAGGTAFPRFWKRLPPPSLFLDSPPPPPPVSRLGAGVGISSKDQIFLKSLPPPRPPALPPRTASKRDRAAEAGRGVHVQPGGTKLFLPAGTCIAAAAVAYHRARGTLPRQSPPMPGTSAEAPAPAPPPLPAAHFAKERALHRTVDVDTKQVKAKIARPKPLNGRLAFLASSMPPSPPPPLPPPPGSLRSALPPPPTSLLAASASVSASVSSTSSSLSSRSSTVGSLPFVKREGGDRRGNTILSAFRTLAPPTRLRRGVGSAAESHAVGGLAVSAATSPLIKAGSVATSKSAPLPPASTPANILSQMKTLHLDSTATAAAATGGDSGTESSAATTPRAPVARRVPTPTPRFSSLSSAAASNSSSSSSLYRTAASTGTYLTPLATPSSSPWSKSKKRKFPSPSPSLSPALPLAAARVPSASVSADSRGGGSGSSKPRCLRGLDLLASCLEMELSTQSSPLVPAHMSSASRRQHASSASQRARSTSQSRALSRGAHNTNSYRFGHQQHMHGSGHRKRHAREMFEPPYADGTSDSSRSRACHHRCRNGREPDYRRMFTRVQDAPTLQDVVREEARRVTRPSPHERAQRCARRDGSYRETGRSRNRYGDGGVDDYGDASHGHTPSVSSYRPLFARGTSLLQSHAQAQQREQSDLARRTFSFGDTASDNARSHNGMRDRQAGSSRPSNRFEASISSSSSSSSKRTSKPNRSSASASMSASASASISAAAAPHDRRQRGIATWKAARSRRSPREAAPPRPNSGDADREPSYSASSSSSSASSDDDNANGSSSPRGGSNKNSPLPLAAFIIDDGDGPGGNFGRRRRAQAKRRRRRSAAEMAASWQSTASLRLRDGGDDDEDADAGEEHGDDADFGGGGGDGGFVGGSMASSSTPLARARGARRRDTSGGSALRRPPQKKRRKTAAAAASASGAASSPAMPSAGSPDFPAAQPPTFSTPTNPKTKLAATTKSGEEDAAKKPRRRCTYCLNTDTPLWRNGPAGPKSLCNACAMYLQRHGSLSERDKNWWKARKLQRANAKK